ncbi:MAG: hypothetical protein M3297_11895 [Thermoproteota archaeon]|jgi:hypothetical protein|nr:hypothetical protein [Thermoproteota archaeon]
MVRKKATRPKNRTTKSRTATRKTKSATSGGSDEKYQAQYTTRHGSHLTKTTVGVSDTEADIKEEVE